MVEGGLGGRLTPGIAKKPEPHILNFEDTPGESVPDLDDQVSGDGRILDSDGNQPNPIFIDASFKLGY